MPTVLVGAITMTKFLHAWDVLCISICCLVCVSPIGMICLAGCYGYH